MSRLSIIIPSFNSFKTLPQTLESIFNQKAMADIQEIILVDSSDDQKTRECIESFKRPQFKTILLTEKTLPAVGRNIGAAQAKGELLAFIDSDMTLDRSWVQEIMIAYEEGCLAGGGLIVLPDFQKNDQLAVAQYYLQLNEYLGGTRSLRQLVPSCNLFCQRSLFEQAGGFPEIRAAEDSLFCLKLGKLTKIWFVPEAKCSHTFRQDWEGFLKNQELLGKYILLYRRDYYKSWIYRGIIPVLLLPGFLLIKLTRMVTRIQRAGGGHTKKFFKAIIPFMLGLGYWSIGFVKGCFDKNK